MDIVACPDPTCQAPAWVYDRWIWPTTDGPVEHVKTGCERGHWFSPTMGSLDLQPAINGRPTPVSVP